jgi:ribosomal protein S18 acetylase RimI-like enzyme
MPANALIPLTSDSLPAAARVLATAFEHDPLYSFMVPAPASRIAGLEEYFAVKLQHELDDGSTLSYMSPSGGTVLVAQTVDPDAEHGPALSADSREALGHWVSAEHVDEIADVFDGIPHPHHPHIYLDVIASAPGVRGQGEGTALATAWFDVVGDRAVHLQSSNPRNLGFYERLGFVASEPIVLRHGAGQLIPMDRAGAAS